jgi:hypothetical protein
MAGGGAFGIFALIEFCENHSGCMEIINHGDGESQTKIMCTTDYTFPPQLCSCPQGPPFTTQSASPSTSSCTPHGNETAVTPVVGNIKDKDECVGDMISGKTPYLYYTYRIMTPIGALLNIGGQVGSGVKGFFDHFLKLLPKILMWAGIGVGCIILILIIYKVIIHFIEKRKSSSG